MLSSDIQPIVEMRGITKLFPGVRALDQVNFNVYPGEIRGLVGKNGAGKSTLMHILTGLYPPTQGEISIAGKAIAGLTSTLARDLGISIVHQHSQMIPTLSMAENIYCGKLPKNHFGLIDWPRIFREAQASIAQLGLHIDVRRTIEGASIAEIQMIEIVKALFAKARVVVLDEATAPLPKSEVELLFSFVRRLRDQGVSFVYISHYLEEVFQLCDTVTVLRDGSVVGDYPVSKLTQTGLIGLISGSKVEQFRRIEQDRHAGAPALQIKNLSRESAYTNINLTLCQGEVVGLTGLDGCGKDFLARGLFGLEPLGEGEVQVDQKPFRPAKEPKEAIAQGLAYLPRDRHGYGIVRYRPIRENVTLPILRRLLNGFGILDLPQEKAHVSGLIEKLNIRTPSPEQQVQLLSGGNQQKVVFAKLIGVRPKVLLLDEPTQGVDVQAKVEILKIIADLARQDMCVVVVSEEIRELLDICDRVLVMFRGQVTNAFHVGAPDTTYQRILMAVEGSLQQEKAHETA